MDIEVVLYKQLTHDLLSIIKCMHTYLDSKKRKAHLKAWHMSASITAFAIAATTGQGDLSSAGEEDGGILNRVWDVTADASLDSILSFYSSTIVNKWFAAYSINPPELNPFDYLDGDGLDVSWGDYVKDIMNAYLKNNKDEFIFLDIFLTYYEGAHHKNSTLFTFVPYNHSMTAERLSVLIRGMSVLNEPGLPTEYTELYLQKHTECLDMLNEAGKAVRIIGKDDLLLAEIEQYIEQENTVKEIETFDEIREHLNNVDYLDDDERNAIMEELDKKDTRSLLEIVRSIW